MSLFQSMVNAVGQNKRTDIAEVTIKAQPFPWLTRDLERPLLSHEGPQRRACQIMGEGVNFTRELRGLGAHNLAAKDAIQTAGFVVSVAGGPSM